MATKEHQRKAHRAQLTEAMLTKVHLSALKVSIAKLSDKFVAMPDEEESNPDHENPSNLIKKNRH